MPISERLRSDFYAEIQHRPIVAVAANSIHSGVVAEKLSERGFIVQMRQELNVAPKKPYHRFADLKVAFDVEEVQQDPNGLSSPVLAVVDSNKVTEAFDAGADHCVSIPDMSLDLIPHVAKQAIEQSWKRKETPAFVKVGEDMMMDPRSGLIRNNKGENIARLTRRQLELVGYLAFNPEGYSAKDLQQMIYKKEGSTTIVLVSHVREKMGEDFIVTNNQRYNLGFRYNSQQSQSGEE